MEQFRNPVPEPVFETIEELRNAMTHSTPAGAAFLDFLLQGPYLAGKGIWVNRRPEVAAFFRELVEENPHLQSENPYSTYYRTDRVRTRGENKITFGRAEDAPPEHKQAIARHRRARAAGQVRPVALFGGGPAAKIGAILAAMSQGAAGEKLAIKFVLDGAEQSNESGSASYEHVNHANALNAEHDNTGLGILVTAVKRALIGEPDPAVALGANYKKVDLWPRAIRVRDIPIYLGNELHGRWQTLKACFRVRNDHVKSRVASKISTEILAVLERELDCSFRLSNEVKRAIFLYFTRSHFRHSLKDNAELAQSVGLRPQGLSAVELTRYYGAGILNKVMAADLFPENACIRHGFDAICCDVMERLGVGYLHRHSVRHVYVEGGKDGCNVVAVVTESPESATSQCHPVDYVALSLGPTATYHYGNEKGLFSKLADRMSVGLPVPYQTIATGISAQVLFRIVDFEKAKVIPFTGMKQTHFVEIGRTRSHLLMKLTCGGVVGIPVYSRSYGISALASLLRTITPEMGLQFEDVICAWPCTRAVNASNNGQIAYLTNNCVVRFGEGGTGMSKMGTNAQTMLDLLGVDWPLSMDTRMSRDLYKHTIVDRRSSLAKRLL